MDDDITYIPVATEQTPLPYSIIGVSRTNPSAKTLIAMFKFEDDRDNWMNRKTGLGGNDEHH